MVRLWPTSQNTFYFHLDLFLFIYLTSFHQEEKKTYTSKFSGENELIQTKVKNKIFKFIYQKNRFEHVVSPLDRLRICGKGAYARFIYRARAPRPLLDPTELYPPDARAGPCKKIKATYYFLEGMHDLCLGFWS